MDYTRREKEHGNVLFLILIAVALFAALSYAVTQSTRGGGNADDETSLISSASLTQYPASLKTTILRMSISDGVSDDALEFNPPSDIGDCSGTGTNCVFSSAGGGASYQQAPSNVMAGGSSGTWVFNMNNEIEDIGSDGGAAANAEVIAFLQGVSSSVCLKINEELGIGSVIPDDSGIDESTLQDDTFTFSAGGVIDGDGTSDELEGQPFGCYRATDHSNDYVYYHTLSEN